MLLISADSFYFLNELLDNFKLHTWLAFISAGQCSSIGYFSCKIAGFNTG